MIIIDLFAYGTAIVAAGLCVALLVQWGRAKAYQLARCWKGKGQAGRVRK